MTEAEAVKCRVVAQQFRALKAENQQLRRQLAEKHGIDLRMNAEDEEVFALVRKPKPQLELVTPISNKAPFDYDTAEIEEITGELVEYKPKAAFSSLKAATVWFYIRYFLLILAGCGIWTAHHFGWIDFVISMAATILLYLIANYFRLI